MANFRSRGVQLVPYENHEEWLKIRRGYIGGSDAGAIVGLNPYSSAFSVWAEKTGQTPEFEGNVSTRVGNELEDFVAHLFMEETGKKVARVNATILNHQFPWACANIDREVLGEDALLEIKTTNSWDVSKMTRNGQYPDMWWAQVCHYLCLSGCQKAYLAVLVECRELKIFELSRDEDEIRALMDAEREFWNTYVLPKKTPPVDGHSATSEAVKQIFSEEAGDFADLSGLTDVFQQRKILTEQIKALKGELDGLDNKIKVTMGSAATGECGIWKVSWKLQNTAALDRDAIKADYPDIDFSRYTKQSRVFRVTEKKVKSA